jgi:hypothetical protein
VCFLPTCAGQAIGLVILMLQYSNFYLVRACYSFTGLIVPVPVTCFSIGCCWSLCSFHSPLPFLFFFVCVLLLHLDLFDHTKVLSLNIAGTNAGKQASVFPLCRHYNVSLLLETKHSCSLLPSIQSNWGINHGQVFMSGQAIHVHHLEGVLGKFLIYLVSLIATSYLFAIVYGDPDCDTVASLSAGLAPALSTSPLSFFQSHHHGWRFQLCPL